MTHMYFKIIASSILVLFLFSGCSLFQSQQKAQTTSSNNTISAQNNTNNSTTPAKPIRAAEYSITDAQEKAFFDATAKTLSSETQNKLRADLQHLKQLYPEGYFVIIKVGTAHPDGVKNFYDTSMQQEGSRVNLLIHELTHIASETSDPQKYAFQKEDLVLSVPYNNEYLSLKGGLRTYVSKINYNDETYLNNDNGDIYGTLDELNAYTKSMRTQIAYQNIDPPENLYFEYDTTLRQILHLAIGLYHAQQNNLNEWKELTANTGFAYMLFNIKKDAEAELGKVNLSKAEKSEATDGITETQQELKKYSPVFDAFFTAAQIKQGEREIEYHDNRLENIHVFSRQL